MVCRDCAAMTGARAAALRHGETLSNLKEADRIVVAARGEESVVGRPCEAADLLSVRGQTSKQSHGTVPVIEVALIVIRPLDGVNVDMASLVTDQ